MQPSSQQHVRRLRHEGRCVASNVLPYSPDYRYGGDSTAQDTTWKVRQRRQDRDRRGGSGRRIMLTRRREQVPVVSECRKRQRRTLAYRRSGKERRRTAPETSY